MRQWATNRKVAEFFNDNPSGRAVAFGQTLSLTEISKDKAAPITVLPGGRGGLES